jgi:hypothetical protein
LRTGTLTVWRAVSNGRRGRRAGENDQLGTRIGRQLCERDDAARDAAGRTLPDQILQDTFVQHVKAVCVRQLRLEARTETLDQHRDGVDEGNAPDHGSTFRTVLEKNPNQSAASACSVIGLMGGRMR